MASVSQELEKLQEKIEALEARVQNLEEQLKIIIKPLNSEGKMKEGKKNEC